MPLNGSYGFEFERHGGLVDWWIGGQVMVKFINLLRPWELNFQLLGRYSTSYLAYSNRPYLELRTKGGLVEIDRYCLDPVRNCCSLYSVLLVHYLDQSITTTYRLCHYVGISI